MVDLSSLLSDEDLRRRYGTPTLDRAWDYVRRGHVLSCTHDLDGDGDLDIRGTVAGSTSAPYVVTLSVGVDGEGVWVFGRCSCPVGEGCKHRISLQRNPAGLHNEANSVADTGQLQLPVVGTDTALVFKHFVWYAFVRHVFAPVIID